MNPDPQLSIEDHFTSLMAACDDALAADATGLGECDLPPELRARLERDLACVKLLQQLRPTQEPGVASDSRSMQPRDDQAQSQTPSDANTVTLPRFPPFQKLGRFEIRRELGRGGFGIVYLAYDPHLRREVALKIPRADVLVNPEARARFQQEARAAAGLDHPNLVPVYETGAVGPIHFIALGYCPGISLAAWLKDRAKPVPYADAAQLIATLAHAVEHAHHHGVWHRDLKPANILLQRKSETRNPKSETNPKDPNLIPETDGKQVLSLGNSDLKFVSDFEFRISDFLPKITDFGLAKCMEGEGFQTRTEAVLGTPSYMAPEQTGGKNKDVGPATDVYALGAILYELLTGRPPFLGESPLDTLAQVQGHEPVAPSRLRPQVPRDLETICLRCLQKEPRKRYLSAAALAEDLRCFQAGKPIVARPVGMVERGLKWARRRPASAVLAGATVLGLLGGVSGLLWYAEQERDRANREGALRREAEAEKIKAETEKQRADQEANTARAAEADTRAFSSFLVDDVLAVARPEGVQGGLGVDVTVAQALEAAEPKLEQEFADRPLAEARARHAIGVTWRNLGKYAAAERHLRRAIDLFRQELDPNDPQTLDSSNSLGATLGQAGRAAEAIALLEQVRDARVKKLGDDHPSTLATLGNLAGAYRASGRTAEAIALFEQVGDAKVKKLGADHPDTLVTLNGLAAAYQTAGKTVEAIALFEQVRDARVKKLGADHPDTLTTLSNLAVAYQDAGRTVEAIALLEQVRDAQVKKLGADHPGTLTTLSNLAGAYFAAGKTAEATALLEQVRDAQVKKLGADHPSTLTTLDSLGNVYRVAGKTTEAIALLEQVRDGRVKMLGADHPSTLSTLNNLAVAYQAAGKTSEAIGLYEQVRDAQVKKLGADHAHTVTTLSNLAVAYQAAGKLEQALPMFQQAVTGIEKRKFVHPYAGGIVGNLIDCHERLKQYNDAEMWRRKWLAVVKEHAGPESIDYAGELAGLGLTLLRQQKHGEAQQTIRDSLAIRAKQQPDAWTTFNTKSLLGGALLGQQKYAEAEPLLKEGYEGMKLRQDKIPPQSKIRLTEALERLVRLYEATGNPSEATKWRKELEAATAKKP